MIKEKVQCYLIWTRCSLRMLKAASQVKIWRKILHWYDGHGLLYRGCLEQGFIRSDILDTLSYHETRRKAWNSLRECSVVVSRFV